MLSSGQSIARERILRCVRALIVNTRSPSKSTVWWSMVKRSTTSARRTIAGTSRTRLPRVNVDGSGFLRWTGRARSATNEVRIQARFQVEATLVGTKKEGVMPEWKDRLPGGPWPLGLWVFVGALALVAAFVALKALRKSRSN